MLIPFAPAVAGLDDDSTRRSFDAVHRAVIDGAVTDGLPLDHPAVQALADRGIPVVHSSDTTPGRCVAIDDRAAGQLVGRHLAGLGHRDVAVIVASDRAPGRLTPVDEPTIYPSSRDRLDSIRDGLGVDAHVRVLSAGRNATDFGRVAAAAALEHPRRPTAIAADSDVMATAVTEVIRDRGLHPGRDVSVTGFDDVPLAAAHGLTMVRQSVAQKGRVMGRMLLDPTYTETRVVLPTELVIRSSTGPAPTSKRRR